MSVSSALPAVLEAKGKLRGKTKAQRKKEEKEKKVMVKTQGDELKDALADNDDSSSTTTETSNPDVEASIKEVDLHICLCCSDAVQNSHLCVP